MQHAQGVAIPSDQAWEHAHTRYPFIDGSPENIIGFVHVRDLLDPAHRGRPVTVGEIMRGMKVFPAMKHLLPTLSEMQAAGAHIAMVVDEYGAILGVVTVENLVEKLVGDIYDEYDTVPSSPHSIESGLGEMDGLVSLGEFRQRTGVGLPVGPYDTVGGWFSRSAAA